MGGREGEDETNETALQPCKCHWQLPQLLCGCVCQPNGGHGQSNPGNNRNRVEHKRTTTDWRMGLMNAAG